MNSTRHRRFTRPGRNFHRGLSKRWISLYIEDHMSHELLPSTDQKYTCILRLSTLDTRLGRTTSPYRVLRNDHSSMVDVKTKACVDFELTKHFNERKAAVSMLRSVRKGDILLFDRGYYSKSLLQRVHASKAFGVWRLKINAFKGTRSFFTWNLLSNLAILASVPLGKSLMEGRVFATTYCVVFTHNIQSLRTVQNAITICDIVKRQKWQNWRKKRCVGCTKSIMAATLTPSKSSARAKARLMSQARKMKVIERKPRMSAAEKKRREIARRKNVSARSLSLNQRYSPTNWKPRYLQPTRFRS